MVNNIHLTLLIPLFPLLSFVFIGLFVRRHHIAHSISIIATLGSFIIALYTAIQYFTTTNSNHALVYHAFNWLTFSSGIYPTHPQALTVNIGTLIDPLSLTLSLIVSGISLLVQIYSTGYLKGHHGYKRYFSYISFFTGAMLALVLSTNLIQIYIFWELVGLGSFLLIGFYYEKPSAVAACKKAFIVTRFADVGFLIGILILSYYSQSFDFLSLATKLHTAPQIMLSIACALIAIGAFGKSAMFPLHIWLPDAMEGPTPVSALIHAATMVVAGVYLIARLFSVFLLAPIVLQIIAVVGVFTSLFAAIIACTQNDIKRVLAYSTLSQIGYMMLALGVASYNNTTGFSAAIFHVTTHAFFKALLFLGAGAIIHAVGTNDLLKMGALRKKMPITHLTFLIACIAISAFPPFSGFYSKDEILLAVYNTHHILLLSTGIFVAALTAFYIFRIYYLAFYGESTKETAHAHDPPFSMALPMIILALGSISAGWIPFHRFVFYGNNLTHEVVENPNSTIMFLGIIASITGWFFAYILYKKKSPIIDKIINPFSFLYNLAKNKFYIDEIYLFITKQIIFKYISKPLESFDSNIVDGNVNAVGNATVSSATLLSKLSTGKVTGHILSIVGGVLMLILFFWVLN